MNNNLSLMRRAAGLFVLAALGTGLLSSCKEDAPVPTPLDAPQAQLAAATVNSLTFTWGKVTNAVQYGYSLTDPSGSEVDGGTTTATSVVIAGLTDNTTYTFKIMAFAATEDTSHENSATTQLQATTGAIVPLAKPTLKVETGEGTVTISWEAVANAESYDYAYTPEGGTEVTGNTAETSLTLKLDPGKYTFTLQAISSDAAYSASEKASAEFEVAKAEKKQSWTADGTVDDGAGNKWAATLVAWSDGSYTLKDWYNVEGYDLEFYINSDGSISVTNYYEDYYPNIWVSSGDDIDNGWVQLYTATYGSEYYSNFDGDQTEGNFYCYNYRTKGWYEFTWPVTDGGDEDEKTESWSAAGTVDDGAGNKWEATLVAWNDGSYTIRNWYGTEGYNLDFTVNENETITVTNLTTSEGYDYVLADAEKWICIDTKYYEGYGTYSNFSGDKDAGEIWFWSYETNGYYDFTWPASGGDESEKTESWSAAGTVDDGAGNKWEATLVAWNDGSYTIRNWYGTEGYNLDFTVNENETITVTNLTTSEGYDYVLADAEKWICIDTKYYEGYGTYSNFSGDKDAGEIWFWSYETNGYYDFTWPASGGE